MINRRIVGRSFKWVALFTALFQIHLTAKGGGLVQDDNLHKAFENIEDSEYEINWAKDQGTYKAPNRAQNLRFTFGQDSLAVEPRDYGEGNAKPWELNLQFEGITKGERPIVMANPSWRVDHKHAEINAPGITVEYQNEKEGLRQNFRVLAPPVGNDALTLNFRVSSRDLRFKVEENQVSFVDADGTNVLLYSDLNVWDANNKKLEASMVALEGNRFAIVVDDSAAVYPIFVDPLVNASAWTETAAPSIGEKFGYAVAGYSTYFSPYIVIGAPYWDTGTYVDAGKVFVYIGWLSGSPTWTKEGDQSYAKIGWSVACDMDFNGDDNWDIAIGAPFYDAGYTDNGRVWVYPGTGDTTAPGSTPIFTSSPSLGAYAYYGNSLTFLPSVNNDQYNELVVGAPGLLTDAGAGAGKVFMYFGGSTPDTTADWTASGGQAYLQLGYSMAHAENIKGDGKPALVVGAPFSGISQGAVYVYYQSGVTLGNTPTTILGVNNGDKFGFSVAGGFDQDGNGYSDILVGAPNFSNGQTQEGRASVFRGGPSGITTSPFWSVEGNQAYAQLGFSVAMGYMGNSVNLPDGKADLLIGAPYFDTDSAHIDNGAAFAYITNSSDVPVLDASVGGYGKNYDHNGSAVGFLLPNPTSSYNPAWIVGAPDAHDNAGGLTGGTVTVWYQQ